MNATILVVDDEQRIRKLLKDFLVKKDYEVIEAKDGEAFKKGIIFFIFLFLLCFTPETYIARSIFVLACVTYKKLGPSMGKF